VNDLIAEWARCSFPVCSLQSRSGNLVMDSACSRMDIMYENHKNALSLSLVIGGKLCVVVVRHIHKSLLSCCV